MTYKRTILECRASLLTKEFQRWMRRMYGTGETRRLSAMFVTKFPVGIEVNGWHGTGTGNRHYGNLNIIFEVFIPDSSLPLGFRSLTRIDTDDLVRMENNFDDRALFDYEAFLSYTKAALEDM